MTLISNLFLSSLSRSRNGIRVVSFIKDVVYYRMRLWIWNKLYYMELDFQN